MKVIPLETIRLQASLERLAQMTNFSPDFFSKLADKADLDDEIHPDSAFEATRLAPENDVLFQSGVDVGYRLSKDSTLRFYGASVEDSTGDNWWGFWFIAQNEAEVLDILNDTYEEWQSEQVTDEEVGEQDGKLDEDEDDRIEDEMEGMQELNSDMPPNNDEDAPCERED